MTSKSTKKDNFFYVYSILLLVFVFFSFGMYSALGKAKFNSASIFIFFHGTAMALWYILLVLQTRSIKTRDIQRHKRLGYLSIWLAIAVVLSGFLIGVTNYQGVSNASAPMSLLYGNFAFVISFAVYYSLAVIYRSKTKLHKRLMIFASIAMTPPALARFCRILEVNEEALSPPLLLSMLISILVYDIWKYRKIYWPTIFSIVFLLAVLFSIGLVGNSETWSQLVISLFGE